MVHSEGAPLSRLAPSVCLARLLLLVMHACTLFAIPHIHHCRKRVVIIFSYCIKHYSRHNGDMDMAIYTYIFYV